MKYILAICCFTLGCLTAIASDVPQISRTQLQHYVLQQIFNKEQNDPTLKEIQEIVKKHQGDINSLAKKLLGKDPGCCVHSIWYKEGTLLIVRLIHDTGIDGDYFIADFYTPNPVYKDMGETVYEQSDTRVKEVSHNWTWNLVPKSLIPEGMTRLTDPQN